MKTSFINFSDREEIKGVEVLSLNEMFMIRGGGGGDDQGDDEEDKGGQLPPKENGVK